MPWSDVIRMLLKRPLAVACFVVMCLFALCAVGSKFFLHDDALKEDPGVDNVASVRNQRVTALVAELRSVDSKRTEEELVALAEKRADDEIKNSPPAVTNLERSYQPPGLVLVFDKQHDHWKKTGQNPETKLDNPPMPVDQRDWGFFDARAWKFPLGCDIHGTNVLYKLIRGVELAFVIGIIPMLISCFIATIVGLAAGYFGGFVDDAVGFLISTLVSIPGLLLLIAFIQAVRDSEAIQGWFISLEDFLKGMPGFGKEFEITKAWRNLLLVLIVIGLTGWTGLTRLIRAEVLKHKNSEYVIAARALGCGHTRIVFRHILPNVFHLVIITFTLGFVGSVGLEVFLSFIGVGIDSSLHTWGQLISGGRRELQRDPSVWWPITAATIALFMLSLSFSLFGDALRDALDPKLRT